MDGTTSPRGRSIRSCSSDATAGLKEKEEVLGEKNDIPAFRRTSDPIIPFGGGESGGENGGESEHLDGGDMEKMRFDKSGRNVVGRVGRRPTITLDNADLASINLQPWQQSN